MANIKISNLPATTATTSTDVMVKNSNTNITEKISVENFAGLTKGSGVNSYKSAGWISSAGAESTGIGSIAIGHNSEALADNAIAIGTNASVFDNFRQQTTAIGANTICAQFSVGIGSDAHAVGADCIAIGFNTRTENNNAITIGKSSRATADGSVAIGRDSRTFVSADNGVAIGRVAKSSGATSVALGSFAEANASESVAIGNGIVASHARSVCLNENSIFSATTHTQGLYIDNNFSTKVASLFDLASFTIDLNQSPTWEVRLDQNATLDFINTRLGGRYILFINNVGAFDFSSVTAAGLTIKFNGGSRSVLTSTSFDIYEIYRLGNTLFINQIQNFA